MFASLRDKGNVIFRFVMISNNKELKSFKRKFNEIVLSFSKVTREELNLLSPPRVKIISVNSEENFINRTSQKLNLQKMYAKDIFKQINDLGRKEVDVGRKIKSIY